MNWRTRLADWISGGEITKAREKTAWWRDHMVGEIYGPMVDEKNGEIIRIQQNNRALHDNIEKLVTSGAEIFGEVLTLKERMNEIAAMETPSANATVRKMASKARGALQ